MSLSKRLLTTAAISILFPLSACSGDKIGLPDASITDPTPANQSDNDKDKADKRTSKTPEQQAIALIKLASEILTRGNPAEQGTAFSLLDQAISVSDNSPKIQLRVAEVYAKADFADNALKIYHILLVKDPSNGYALLGAGTTLVKQGKLDAGIQMLQKAAPILNNAVAYSRLGVACTQAGKLKDARSSFETAHKLAPDDLDIATNRALAEALDGDYKQAMEHIKEVADSSDTQKQHKTNLVLILALADHVDEARSHPFSCASLRAFALLCATLRRFARLRVPLRISARHCVTLRQLRASLRRSACHCVSLISDLPSL